MSMMLPYALFLGFTAGLFEEVGRYLAYKTILKNHLSWKNSVAFGIGHGGIEALLLVGLVYINNIIMSVMINSGTFDTLIAPTLPEGVGEIVKSSLTGTSSSLFLVGGLERILTFIIHIGFSVFLMMGFKKGKALIYLVIAVLLHMFLDTTVVLLAQNGVSIFVIELIIFIIMIPALVYILKVKKTCEEAITLEEKTE